MFEAAGPLIEERDIELVTDALKNSSGLKKYYYVEKFEHDFAAYHGRKYCLLTPNCTTAIHLILTALDVNEGHRVIAPDITWIGSTAGISWLRANPDFCDIERDSWCLDPKSVESMILENICFGNSTSAIVAVNLYGNMCDWDRLVRLSQKYRVPIVEDFAESLGSHYQGRKSGTFGIASVCSFHRTKTLTTLEGGALLLDDSELYKKCMLLRDHGRCEETKPYFNDIVGYKYMPTNVQGALGCAQLEKLDRLIDIKTRHLARYKKGLSDFSFQWNYERPGDFNSAWITTLTWNKQRYNLTKQQVLDKLYQMDIPVRPFFYPLSSLPAYNTDVFGEYRNYETYCRLRNKVSYDIHDRGISLPGAMTMTEEQIDKTIEAVKEVFKHVA